MEEIKELLSDILNVDLSDMVISGAKSGDVKKIKVRPVLIKNQLNFQVTRYIGTKVFHENAEAGHLSGTLAPEIYEHFRQVQIRTKAEQITALISKKGHVFQSKEKNWQEHTHRVKKVLNIIGQKSYVLKEGVPVPFSDRSWRHA